MLGQAAEHADQLLHESFGTRNGLQLLVFAPPWLKPNILPYRSCHLQETFEDPVRAADGQAYERSAVTDWRPSH